MLTDDQRWDAMSCVADRFFPALRTPNIDRLASEFEELARSDARRPFEERDSCSAILALRAWEFSEFAKLRRARKS